MTRHQCQGDQPHTIEQHATNEQVARIAQQTSQRAVVGIVLHSLMTRGGARAHQRWTKAEPINTFAPQQAPPFSCESS